MSTFTRRISSVFLAVGVLLVFAGFSAGLGFTGWGIVASAAAVVSLMFAGATWFGRAPVRPLHGRAAPLLVFDRDGRIVSGRATGQLLTSQFPEILGPEIDRRCRAALAGTSARFPCLHNGRMVEFDALPVRSADGTIVYGILLSSDAEAATLAESL
ncbi:MAG: hypothetical protein ACRD15_09750 [Vicinamibacterales bacterium]